MEFIKQHKLYIIVAVPLLIAVIIAIIIVSSKNGGPSETSGTTLSASDSSDTGDTAQSGTDTGTYTGATTQSEETEPPETTPPIETLLPAAVESDSYINVSEPFNNTVIMSGTVTLPVFKNPGQSAVIASVNSSVAAFGESYKSNVLGVQFNNAKIELAANGKIPFTFDVGYSVKYSSLTVLSLVFRHVEDFGGTHESIKDKCYNYDMSTGSELKLSQLFNCDTSVYMNKIYSYIESCVAVESDRYYPDYKNLLRVYDYTNKWYFTESGLCVIFNPYQLADFTMGIVSFTVPYSEFTGLMKINPTNMG